MSLGSEDHIIACIERHFPNSGDKLLLGRGDDCAAFTSREALCVSCDLFIEHAHFRRRYFSPQAIGHKALAVNLSDLAACGAQPLGFTLGLALPPDASMDLVDGLFAGMSDLAAQYGCVLMGGDLAKSDHLHLCLTIFGEAKSPLRRGKARAGDTLLLLGEVGLARTGLLLLEAHGADIATRYPAAVAAHLMPQPQVAAGLALHKYALAHPEARIGLMDLSDGLARDLPRLLGLKPSGSVQQNSQAPGGDIRLPEAHPEVSRFCAEQGLNPLEHMFQGGEEYALIGTCAPEHTENVLALVPGMRVLGVATPVDGKKGLVRAEGVGASEGFDHFAPSR